MSRDAPVLVTGARGLLAGHVAAALRAGGRRVEAMGRELDVSDRDSVRRVILGLRPSAVVHCAALTDVDACERDPALARSVNADGCANVAEAAGDVDAAMVSLSSDYVFDGTADRPYTEDDETNPIQVYGRTKVDGEVAVRETCERHFVVRSAFIYGVGGKNFISRLFEYAARGPLKAATDQTGSPTYAPDLAEAIVEMLDSDAYGTYHVTNAGSCSFAEIVRHIVSQPRHDGDLGIVVEDVEMASLPRPAPRPAYTPLDNSRWASRGFAPLRHWRDAAASFAAEAAGPEASIPASRKA